MRCDFGWLFEGSWVGFGRQMKKNTHQVGWKSTRSRYEVGGGGGWSWRCGESAAPALAGDERVKFLVKILPDPARAEGSPHTPRCTQAVRPRQSTSNRLPKEVFHFAPQNPPKSLQEPSRSHPKSHLIFGIVF